MSEMLTGPKKIVDGLTEVFRGLTQMCEGMAEQIELLEFTSEDAEDEDKLLSAPCKPTKSNGGRTRNLPHHLPEDWAKFKYYCPAKRRQAEDRERSRHCQG